MKKSNLKKLNISKKVIANFDTETVQGGKLEGTGKSCDEVGFCSATKKRSVCEC